MTVSAPPPPAPSPATASAAQPRLRLRIAAVATAFLLNGLTFGAWASRIPAVQAQTHLNEAGLGFALLGASVGAVSTMAFGGWLGGKFGTHILTASTLFGCAIFLPLVGASSDFWSLLLSLFAYGIFQGTMDVCMNANGLAVERAGSGPIMSRLHATWSIGSFAGALFSATFAGAGIGVLPEFIVLAVLVAVGGVAVRVLMLPDRHAGEGGGLRLPSGRLLVIGILALCGLLAEGSANDWGGVYMHRSLGASEEMAALAVAVFAGCMAAARLTGDRLTVAVGPAILLSGGAGLSAAGLALVLVFAQPWIAIVGFGLMGIGLAAAAPTLFRAAGSQPGVPSSVGISMVTTMGYAGGLLGPPLIGTIAGFSSLRIALTVVFVLLAILAVSGRRVLAPRAA
jgi:hypothetical protein